LGLRAAAVQNSALGNAVEGEAMSEIEMIRINLTIGFMALIGLLAGLGVVAVKELRRIALAIELLADRQP
jgi:hypothetical protein